MERLDPLRELSANLYDIYYCSVYSEELGSAEGKKVERKFAKRIVSYCRSQPLRRTQNFCLKYPKSGDQLWI
jgi:hypothetical protein